MTLVGKKLKILYPVLKREWRSLQMQLVLEYSVDKKISWLHKKLRKSADQDPHYFSSTQDESITTLKAPYNSHEVLSLL